MKKGKGRKPCVSPQQKASPPAQPTAAPMQGAAISDALPSLADIFLEMGESLEMAEKEFEEQWKDNNSEYWKPRKPCVSPRPEATPPDQPTAATEQVAATVSGPRTSTNWAPQPWTARLCRSFRAQPPSP